MAEKTRQQNEGVHKIANALAALVNLGMDEKALIKVLINNDDEAVAEVMGKIAASGNRAEIIRKLKEATEIMQEAVGTTGSQEAEQLQQTITTELAQLEPSATTTETSKEIEEPVVELPVERWEIVGEDRVAIAAEEASRQHDAIANLTRAETESAARAGGSEPGQSALQLMAVTGADSESINIYLAEQARAHRKKSVTDMTADEFGAVVNDVKSFQQWSARRWVDQLISERKGQARKLAEEKTAIHPARGRWARGSIDPTMESPLASGLKQTESAYSAASSELIIKRRADAEELQTTQAELQAQQAEALTTFRGQLENQRLASTLIETLVEQQRLMFENIRKQIQETKQAASVAYIEQAEAELKKRKAELDQLTVDTHEAIATGVKRELVLSAHRWGGALKSVVSSDPRLIQRNEVTGDITIDVDYIKGRPEAFQALVDQLGKEVDRVLEAKTAGDEKANRIHNLETIITNPAEAAIAELYLKQLLERYPGLGGRGGRPRLEAALQKHDLVWNYLVTNKYATTQHELRALPIYKEAKRELPSALPVLVQQYREKIDSDCPYSMHEMVARQVDQLLELRVRQAEGNIQLHSTFMTGLREMAEVVGKSGVLSEYFYARSTADSILSTFGRWRGGSIDGIKGALYESASKNNCMLWSDRGRDHLADIVEGDFAGRHDEVNDYYQDRLSEAAFGQIELNARSWARTNRVDAKAWLDRVAAKVQDSCAERMPNMGRQYASSVDAAQSVAAWEAKANQAKAIVEYMKKRLDRIAKLKAEL